MPKLAYKDKRSELNTRFIMSILKSVGSLGTIGNCGSHPRTLNSVLESKYEESTDHNYQLPNASTPLLIFHNAGIYNILPPQFFLSPPKPQSSLSLSLFLSSNCICFDGTEQGTCASPAIVQSFPATSSVSYSVDLSSTL